MTLTDTRAILLTDIEMDGSFFEASAAPRRAAAADYVA
jgi:hypothetical protein